MRNWKILIWGTGNWCNRVLQEIPDQVIIEGFIESKPEKTEHLSKKVISKEDFDLHNKNTDYTIVAVRESGEIFNVIQQITDKYDTIFFCRESGGILYCENMVEPGYCSFDSLFADYRILNCQGIYFLMNNRYKMMINSLKAGLNYQQDDIELFFDLSEKYYGIRRETEGFFFDIGGNIGTTSVWVKKKINPRLKIVSFEPVKENCKQFHCNCALNEIDADEYILVNAGLSNRNAEADCMLSAKNLGDNRIAVNGNEDITKETESIRTIRLDDWIEESMINRNEIKYIWMDVQAHEGFVIDGGIKTFRSGNIPLFMEFWPVELIKNKSLEMLVDELSKCYRKFINIQWYKNGDREEYEIEKLVDIADNYKHKGFFDLFFIK